MREIKLENLRKTIFSGFVKDPKSNVVLNSNDEQLAQFKVQRERKKELDSLRKDIDMLKKEVIKLNSIIERFIEKD